MKIVKTIPALRKWMAQNKGKTVGLVPTMGALHDGHLSLVRRSARDNDLTVVSIFVNPLQFGANEDLDKYPRRLSADAAMCASAGADVVYAPDAASMYADDHQTYVYNEPLEVLYCGAHRPGHFKGVLTVVAKLFLAVEPDAAYFGKKDYQQAFLIRKMVQDLNWNIRIGLVPTSREKDGLARSSRNEYLSPDERRRAPAIYQAMQEVKTLVTKGETKINKLRTLVRNRLVHAGGEVQYVEIASAQTLQPLEGKLNEKSVLLIAVWFGKTRLIDNIEL